MDRRQPVPQLQRTKLACVCTEGRSKCRRISFRIKCSAKVSNRLQYPTAARPTQPVAELSSLYNLAHLHALQFRPPTGRWGQAPHVQLRAQAAPATQSAASHTKKQQASSAQSATSVPANGHAQSEGNRHRQQNATSSTSKDSDACQAESLRLLEWPEVCQQVRQAVSLLRNTLLLLLWSTSTVLTVQRCSKPHAAAHIGISTCLHSFQQKLYILPMAPSAAVLAHSTCNSKKVTPCAAGLFAPCLSSA